MSVKMAGPEHEAAWQDVCKVLKKYGHLPPAELLALMANVVGKLIAMQDQRTMSPEMAMEIVAKNIEHGNRLVLEQLMNSKGSA